MRDKPLLATLKASRLNWAVAAIHGEIERLEALHALLSPRIKPGDNLIYLGNFLGVGGGVGAVVDEMLRFRRAFLALGGVEPEDIVFLRGGQEEMWHKLLQIHFAPDPRAVLEWMLRRGLAGTLAAYGSTPEAGLQAAGYGTVALAQWTGALRDTLRAQDGHNSLLTALSHAACTEHGTLLFVNSGLDPDRKLDEQGDAFWWGGGGFDRLAGFYRGSTRAVRGFDPRHRGVAMTEGFATIDGGCGFGGPLVAACFEPSGNLADLIEA